MPLTLCDGLFLQVLRLLLVAWDRRLIFSVGTSSTTGESDTVIWNEVHHKTEFGSNLTGHGYPDPGHLDNVLEELKAQGITEEECLPRDWIQNVSNNASLQKGNPAAATTAGQSLQIWKGDDFITWTTSVNFWQEGCREGFGSDVSLMAAWVGVDEKSWFPSGLWDAGALCTNNSALD